ncbi:hypothetical protein Gbth_014_017 [Gluconobacter thailandicus F149-1 = NBRC 100600]|uniref:hypothetical protein n=1 Tax=Gluconobacter thailandicus TaxID=257438 RepID=UPI0005E54523|nr:hypothetical protein [Gluconobacter thailandicus]GAN92661.1 hypothetical protein Gbth_014_017 [Gluconobacter thailandicus F149-1 = NBRC 100600]GBR58652.1 hypothetical protein AA100600_0911 [Gluconobacter thailandicus F149-1 = NBRC 100600]GEL88480.1 hypothetical protein GTH01_28380 [Gluconobacter thailandicus F149-1 = NBRC 100600]
MSYITLYALYDWMKKGKWDNTRICKEENWSASQLNDFTNTANNPVFLGPYCRHGGSTGPSPKRPVLLKDTIPGIMSAIRAYIKERGENIDIQSELYTLIV